MLHETSRRAQPVSVPSFAATDRGLRAQRACGVDVDLRALRPMVLREGPLPPERAVSIVRRAARELAATSGAGRETGRSRIHALGAALFFALTGTTPSPAAPLSPSQLSPYKVPPALDAVVRTCLAKEPADRFGSAMELAAALAAISVGEGHALPAG